MEEERVVEPTTDTAGKLPHGERRRRTPNNDHPPPSWKELGDRMETPQEKQPVRWQSENVENGRPIRQHGRGRGHFRVEYKQGRSATPQNGTQETATATSLKRPKKLKIDKKDDTPVRRRSRSKTKDIISL